MYLISLYMPSWRVQKRFCFFHFFFGRNSPPVGQGLLIHEVSRSHTTTHHRRQDSSGRVISSQKRPLPDNTQHSQQTDIHAHGGIRTHNPSWRTAADLRLRPRGHWDRGFFNHSSFYISLYFSHSHFILKNCQVKEHHVGKGHRFGHLMGNAQQVL